MQRPDRPLLPRVTAFALAAVALWCLSAAWVNSGQFGDSVEQFVWAHSLEWGYWKHPPLPTWLLAALVRGIGFWPYWTYVLAALCFALTLVVTGRIATRLGGPRAGALTVLLLGLHLGFSWRAQLYNHNTVLLPLCALTVWATLQALDRQRLRDWLLAGLWAGLAMLAKYQALLHLVGILVALAASGAWRQPRVRTGVLLALATALLVFSPHLLHLLNAPGSPLRYSMHAAQGLALTDGLRTLLGYWVNALRVHLPVLAAMALLVLFTQPPSPIDQKAVAFAHGQAERRAWLLGLVVWPVLALSLMALLGGVRLQAHWGLSAFQFLVVFLACRLSVRVPDLRWQELLATGLAVHLALAGFFAWSHSSKTPTGSQLDRAYPARELAQAVAQDWARATACPLAVISGPMFEAGLVSLHTGYPPVVEDHNLAKSPWVAPADLQRLGVVYLGTPHLPLPAGRPVHGQWTPPPSAPSPGPVVWSFVLPPHACIQAQGGGR